MADSKGRAQLNIACSQELRRLLEEAGAKIGRGPNSMARAILETWFAAAEQVNNNNKGE